MAPPTETPPPDEKRYLSPHVYVVTWDAYWEAFQFMNMTGPYEPRRPLDGPPPNLSLRRFDLYSRLLEAQIEVFWEDKDRSPREFHHQGKFTDGIGRKYDWAWGENFSRTLSDDFLDDPERPMLRGAHNWRDHQMVQAQIKRMPTQDVAPLYDSDSGDYDDDDGIDRAIYPHGRYPGAVKVRPARGPGSVKIRRAKEEVKGKKGETTALKPDPTLRRKRAASSAPAMKGSRAACNDGYQNNAARLADNKKPRGRPRKVPTALTDTQVDLGPAATVESATSMPAEGNSGALPARASPSRQESCQEANVLAKPSITQGENNKQMVGKKWLREKR